MLIPLLLLKVSILNCVHILIDCGGLRGIDWHMEWYDTLDLVRFFTMLIILHWIVVINLANHVQNCRSEAVFIRVYWSVSHIFRSACIHRIVGSKSAKTFPHFKLIDLHCFLVYVHDLIGILINSDINVRKIPKHLRDFVSFF